MRAGSDIAFLGGLINYVLTHERWFKEYVLAYTNAATIIDAGYRDSEDLAGVFSGYDANSREYQMDEAHWGYEKTGLQAEGEGSDADGANGDQAGKRKEGSHGIHGYGIMGGASAHTTQRSKATQEPEGQAPRDETLQDPRCVMQLLRRHFARYTPETVSQICGCSPEQLIQTAELLCDNSGRERTSAICYAVGWTQHSNGVQIIRAAGILQTLLGNIGRPGGGILALRGHASIQGSTDIPTLYDLLPGYLPQPICDPRHETLDGYCEMEGLPTGYWVHFKEFTVSLLKAWYGKEAQPENHFRFQWLPRVDQDYSMVPYFDKMAKGEVEGYFVMGQNPAAGTSNGKRVRKGLRSLKWLVVADWFETETAMFWRDDPQGPPSAEIGTEVFFVPAASMPEKEGSVTNTQRLLQWHDKAIDPPGDCRSDLWFVYNLGKKLKELYRDSIDPKDAALLNLTWDYDYEHPPFLPDGTPSRIEGEPDANRVLQEINGWHTDKTDPTNGKPLLLSGFSDCKDDGSTACGAWIYSGVFPNYGRNRARDRQGQDSNPLHPNWGFAWPHNRRILYNRASADPQGKPWSERKRYLWWDEAKRTWAGNDEPDFPPDKAPAYRPAPDAKGMDAIGGADPFIMKPDGKAWLFAPGGTKDGPLPAHYEPIESPVSNLLYPKYQDNPTVRYFEGPDNQIAHTPESDYPIVACTFRMTEHYLSGPMSRFNSWLNELMPAMFVELSPELAEEKGIVNGGWLTVTSKRGEIEARALVTRRLQTLAIQGQSVHQIGIPFQWGYAGETVGSSVNDLIAMSAEPNVSMHETKVFACQVRAGRASRQPIEPTVETARWANRERIPDTPNSAQPEGHMRRSQ
jgi:formate dehydrogenase major subunit